MIKSLPLKIRTYLFAAVILTFGLTGLSFTTDMNEQQWLFWSNKCLEQSFDPLIGTKLKKWDINITDNAFVRMHKTYSNNKQEYFSFHLRKFNNLNFYGTSSSGVLQLNTIADDIIVQTFNDPKGDVDSMASSLNIQVKNITPEQLDSLDKALLYLKGKQL